MRCRIFLFSFPKERKKALIGPKTCIGSRVLVASTPSWPQNRTKHTLSFDSSLLDASAVHSRWKTEGAVDRFLFRAAPIAAIRLAINGSDQAKPKQSDGF